jgi:O-antigen/teichoic acid export membrane protein
VLALGGLIVACLIASGPPLIETLYDPRYHDAGWILQLLAVGAWFQILEVPSGSALLALGLPRWLAGANALKLGGILVLVPTGFWLFGFPGAIGGFVLAETFRYATCVVGASRRELPALGGDLVASALVGLAAACGLYAGCAIGDAGGPAWSRLGGAVIAALLAWLPASWGLLHRQVRELFQAVKEQRS